MKNTTLREITIRSINCVEGLLERFRHFLNGGSANFSEIDKSDLMEILGLEDYELEELMNREDS